MNGQKVIKVGVQGPRKLDWYEPHELEGREPAVFTVWLVEERHYTPCGAYCLIDYMYPRYKGPRRPAHQAETRHIASMVPRIKAALGERNTRRSSDAEAQP